MRMLIRIAEWKTVPVMLVVWNVAVAVFLLAPLLVVVAVSLNPQSITFPPEGFTLRWYVEMFRKQAFVDATRVSFVIATVAATVSTVLGTMAGVSIVRYPNRYTDAVSLLLLSPLLIPSIILAMGLYQFLVLVNVPRTLLVLLVGHVLITVPFPTRTTIAVLKSFDRSLEDAAYVLGASRFLTFRRITFPSIKTGIVAGFIFAFIVSWNDFTTSLFLVGPGSSTLPLQIYGYIQYEYKPIIAAMSSAVILLSGLALLAFDRWLGISTVSGGVQRA